MTASLAEQLAAIPIEAMVGLEVSVRVGTTKVLHGVCTDVTEDTVSVKFRTKIVQAIPRADITAITPVLYDPERTRRVKR